MEINLTIGGGRGSSSTLVTPSGGKWSNGVGFQSYDTLGDALGKKGDSKSMADAMLESNPHYDGSYREFSENCQRAVIAYEARRRGYNVTAQPTFDGDKLPKVAHVDKNGTMQAHWSGAFQGAKQQKVGGNTGQQAQKNLENQMASYGDGSRGIMQLFWKGGGGHVINVEQQGGKTRYIDAQIGKEYKPSVLFKMVKPHSVQLLRTDNLKFSERAKKSVTKDKW